MYKVYKPTGNGLVSVENMDTHASVVIGKANMEIIKVIEEAGYEAPVYTDEWNLEVNKECATTLATMAMRMKKPIRDQRKKKEEPKPSAEVDMFDLIYGI